jgi:hypothetical protein
MSLYLIPAPSRTISTLLKPVSWGFLKTGAFRTKNLKNVSRSVLDEALAMDTTLD